MRAGASEAERGPSGSAASGAERKLERVATGPATRRHAFATLDGLRAVAAAAVVIHHGPDLFGVPGGSLYLAVDLFFVVSGFVIAEAYGATISAQGAPAFLRRRLARLFPLYALGLAFGTAVALREAARHADASAADLAVSFAAALVLLPVPSAGAAFLYPLMPVAWSLALEIGVNALAAAVWSWLRGWVLVTILAGAALALAVVAMRHGDLDVGWNGATAIGGPPRAFYGFAAGLLLHRLWATGRGRVLVPAPLVLAATLLALAVPPPVPRAVWDCAIVVALAPALVWLAVCSAPSSRLRPVFLAAGGISYAVYALHLPLLRLGRALFADVLTPPWSGFACLVLVAAVGSVATVFYERPLRRWRKALPRLTLRAGVTR